MIIIKIVREGAPGVNRDRTRRVVLSTLGNNKPLEIGLPACYDSFAFSDLNQQSTKVFHSCGNICGNLKHAHAR
jgi:hypothetical protein